MTTVLHASSASEFLALVPRLVGFHPARSIVLVPFRRGKSRGALRLDLPTHADHVEQIAATMLGLVCRVPEADACAVVLYGEQAAPLPELVRELERRADACGVAVCDALWVHGDQWGRYATPDAAPQPVAIDAVRAPGQSAVDSDQFVGAHIGDGDPFLVQAVTDAREQLTRAACAADRSERGGTPNTSGLDPQAVAALDMLDDLPVFFERLLSTDIDALDPYEIAVALWVCERAPLRDVALMTWLDGVDAGDAAALAQLEWERGKSFPDDIGMRLWGEGPRPSGQRIDRALTMARSLAIAAPRDAQPGALGLCAWFAWAEGRSTHADAYATQALQIDPSHGLSEIVRTFVHHGHLPDWAFRAPDDDAA